MDDITYYALLHTSISTYHWKYLPLGSTHSSAKTSRKRERACMQVRTFYLFISFAWRWTAGTTWRHCRCLCLFVECDFLVTGTYAWTCTINATHNFSLLSRWKRIDLIYFYLSIFLTLVRAGSRSLTLSGAIFIRTGHAIIYFIISFGCTSSCDNHGREKKKTR